MTTAINDDEEISQRRYFEILTLYRMKDLAYKDQFKFRTVNNSSQ